MTEKRFSVGFDIGEDYPFYMLKDGGNILFQSTSKIEVEEMCDLLNEQHDALIKKDELLSKILSVNSNYEMCLKELNDVLSKHNIHTLEKLDQVLTNERTW